MSRIVIFVLSAAVAALLGMAVYHSVKPMQEGTSLAGVPRSAGNNDIKFLRDVTCTDGQGRRVIKQEIYDEAFRMIKNAKKFILADIFLINSFQGETREEHRLLSSELAAVLAAKKRAEPEIEILVITDEINSIYGGIEPPEISVMKKAGVSVVFTRMTKMRDSNLMYSPFWRLFVQWSGNPGKPGGIVPNPLSGDGRGISVRSALKMLNFRANHRKILVADSGSEVHSLVMSGNASDASSAHTNTGVLIKNGIWRDITDSELKIAGFSGYSGKFMDALPQAAPDKPGEAEVSFLTEGKIAAKIEKLIGSAGSGDSIDVLMFFFSDAKIAESLIKASGRGAKIRVILDPNKDAFGMKKNGMPNRHTAEKLIKKSKGQIKIKWYDTHGEQCHAKMILLSAGGNKHMMTGSANMTRRNLRDYNLEADVLISGNNARAINEAAEFFDSLWHNKGMNCTVDYDMVKTESLLLGLWTDFQEAAGFCTF